MEKNGITQQVTKDQYSQLESAGEMKLMNGLEEFKIKNGSLKIPASMEGQSVSLFVIEWN